MLFGLRLDAFGFVFFICWLYKLYIYIYHVNYNMISKKVSNVGLLVKRVVFGLIYGIKYVKLVKGSRVLLWALACLGLMGF